MKKQILKQLKTLTGFNCVSGNEADIANYLVRILKPIVDECSLDSVGNVVAIKGKPKMCIFSHIDKVGYVAAGCNKKLISVVALKKAKGYPGSNTWPVRIVSNSVCHSGSLFQDKNEGNLWVKTKEDVSENIKPGMLVCFDSEFKETKSGIVITNSLDNCLGITTAIEVIKKAKNICFVGTVQEEMSSLGAMYAAQKLDFEKVIVLDATYAGKGNSAKLGHGPTICLKDDYWGNKQMIEGLINVAEKLKVDYQVEVLENGGSDIKGIVFGSAGTKFVFIGIPVEGMHTPYEKADLQDVEKAAFLLTEFVKNHD